MNTENRTLPELQNANLGTKIAKEIFEWIDIFCSAIFLMLFLFMFVFRLVTVDGESMIPTLAHQDKLVISGLFYTPKTGDIVIIEVDGYEEPFVKRVIATEGQEIDIDFENWIVKVDGKVLEEDYINRVLGAMKNKSLQEYPYKVKKGEVFVMGDNRNNSTDSRELGPMKADNIIGRVLFRVLPFADFGVVE